MRISDWSSDVCSSDLPGGQRAFHQRAGGIDDVGAENGKARLGDTLAGHRRAEVELVVSEHHDVEFRLVEQVDHVGALIEAGQQRGRDGVAAVGEDGMLGGRALAVRSEEHTSELQSLMRISYAVFCLKNKHRTT